MRAEIIIADENQKVSWLISKQYPAISYSTLQKLFRKKDIKLNGKRISKDLEANVGDEIIFYLDDLANLMSYEEIYEDENILVVNKKRGIETVSLDNNVDLLGQIEREKQIKIFAVHRLDRNTEGLVIFAKNLDAKNELDAGFKNRTFEKYYLAKVYGVIEKKSQALVAYLKKDATKSVVQISDKNKKGYEKIQTNYKLVKQLDDSAVVEVELITGKTHQIRAHMAHIGHFIIGDDKYGNHEINKQFGKKYQNLISYKLILHFSKNEKLSYLNGRSFEIDRNKIVFLKNL